MTLYEIVGILKQIALTQPNVKSATDGSVYDVMNTNPSVKYNVVHFSQTKHITDEETDTYGFNIFYISRLEDSLEDNRLQIQSIGKEILDNILRTFCENWGIDYPEILFYPFTQKFADLCAGMYCKVEIIVPKEIICADDYIGEVIPSEKDIRLQDVSVTITENGIRVITPAAGYDGIGEITITTDVPQAGRLEYKEVDYTQNGEYTIQPSPEYDGISSVAVSVNVPNGYQDGYDDGVADQKAKLIATSFTTNNTYIRADGYSAVTVNVPSGVHNQEKNLNVSPNFSWNSAANVYEITVPVDVLPDSGYTGLDKVSVYGQVGATEAIEAGEEIQKAKLSALTVTANGQYDRADGYSAITVNVPQGQGYEEGYEDGEAAQKAKLISLSVTANGQYDREDGYSAVTVDVPDRYDEGYEDGYAAGAAACSGLLATSITLNVADTITESGTATTTYSPSTAYTDIYYTSSDPSKASIDENTGEITVYENGTITICTRDRMSGLRDCKEVNVRTATGCSTVWVIYNVSSTSQPTQILSTRSDAGLDYFSKMLYNGVEYPISTGFTFPATGSQRIDYVLADNVTRMGSRAFYSVPTVREAHFSNCITVTVLSEFEGSGLRTVQLNNGLQNIGVASFMGCNLTSLTVPNSVTGISADAFQSCVSLTSVTIGSGVREMYNSFRHCSGLTRITIAATTPPVLKPVRQIEEIYTFDDTNNCPIYVPAASVNAYKSAASWAKYKNRVQAMP